MPIPKKLEILAAKFIYESNLIERVNITEEDVTAQLKQSVNIGHVGALLYIDSLAENKTHLHKQDICYCQELIIEEQNKIGGHPLVEMRGKGFYRPPGVNVVIAGRMGMPPEKIEKTMGRLFVDIKWFLKKHKHIDVQSNQQIHSIVKRIARFHYCFEHIHPFVDGNGRTGRILVWYLFRFLGLIPFVFTDYDKRYTYYQCFDDARDMEQYFLCRYAV